MLIRRFISKFCRIFSSKIHSKNGQFICSEPSEQLYQSLSENDREKLRCFQEKFEHLVFTEEKIPQSLTDADYLYLLHQSSIVRRWFLRQKYQRNEKILQKGLRQDTSELRRNYRETLLEKSQDELIYGPGFNTMFTRIANDRIFPWQYSRLASAYLLNDVPTMVFDMRWLASYNEREINSFGKEIASAMTLMREHRRPWKPILCNFDQSSSNVRTFVSKYMPYLLADQPSKLLRILPDVSRCSYLELFPPDRLVYLSADAREMLVDLYPDTVYIVGGLSVLSRNRKLARNQAKSDGIKCARFPLERHFRHWPVAVHKDFSIAKTVTILMDVFDGGAWKSTVQNVIDLDNNNNNNNNNN